MRRVGNDRCRRLNRRFESPQPISGNARNWALHCPMRSAAGFHTDGRLCATERKLHAIRGSLDVSYCWDRVVHTSPTQYKNKVIVPFAHCPIMDTLRTYSLPTPPGSDKGSQAWATSPQSGLPVATPSPTRRLISTGGRPESRHSQARFPNSRLDRSVRRQSLTEWPLGVRQPAPERHVIPRLTHDGQPRLPLLRLPRTR